MPTQAELVAAHVASRSRDGGCWEWHGYLKRDGYGFMSLPRNGGKQKKVHVHRYAHMVAHGLGDLHADVCVCHSCDNPSCYNPDHLWAGSKGDNNRDRTAKGRDSDRRGSRNGRAKLSAEQVASIVVDPRSSVAIGRQYGLAHSTVSRIKRREGWTEITHLNAASAAVVALQGGCHQ